METEREKLQKILRGAYKLTFKEICDEPDPCYGVVSTDTFRLFLTPSGFVATTRIRKSWAWGCSLAFPYMPAHKAGKPTKYCDDLFFKTYKCTSIRPIAQYQKDYTKKTGAHIFIRGSACSRPIGVAIRAVCKDIVQAETWKNAILALGERPLKPKESHFCFWTARDRDNWAKYGTGCFNADGFMYALRRDEGRFTYKRIISTSDFLKIIELSNTLPRYAYFKERLQELGYLQAI